MFKPSVTILKTPEGDLKIIECSEDAQKCLDAYKACVEPGEVCYIRKGFTDKRKKVAKPAEKTAPKIQKKAAKKAVKKPSL